MNKKLKIILGLVVLLMIGGFVWNRSGGVPDVIDTKQVSEVEPDRVETINIGNSEMVQVRFSWESNGIKYNDALNILKSEYDKLTAADIERMKQERFENWAKMVNEQSKK